MDGSARAMPALADAASIGVCTLGIDRCSLTAAHRACRRRQCEAAPPTIPATALPGHATVAPPWDQPTIRPAGNRHARQPQARDNHHQPLQEVRHPSTAGSQRNLHPQAHHLFKAGSGRNFHPQANHPPKVGSGRYPQTHRRSKAASRRNTPWEIRRLLRTGSRLNLPPEIRQRSALGNRHQEPRGVHRRGWRHVRQRPVTLWRKRKS
jgi:hypothetical protein